MFGPQVSGKPPLEGLLIIDLTRLLPGPLCTMMLGDYGAEVIKVEDVEAGDPTRFVGRSIHGSGAFFFQINRNKKSLALNLKQEEGREALVKLAARADILVEGFRPGVMDRLGLGYRELSAVNERLIYASISGYGQEGPYRERAGHDLNYTALAGLLDLSADQEGAAPVMPAVQVADIAGGSLMALSGIMIALQGRTAGGKGRFVDVSMTRGLLPWLAYAASGVGGVEGVPRRGRGHITGAYACYNIYETADGKFMSLGALEPVFWRRFCEAAGREDWISGQFDGKQRLELIAEVGKLFKTRTRKEWVEVFAAVDACCEPVLSLPEAMEHPLAREDDFFVHVQSGGGAEEIMTGFPLRFSDHRGEVALLPPGHGEHTAEILQSLGYSQERIAKLRERGIVKTGRKPSGD